MTKEEHQEPEIIKLKIRETKNFSGEPMMRIDCLMLESKPNKGKWSCKVWGLDDN